MQKTNNAPKTNLKQTNNMKNLVIVLGRDCDGQFSPRVYEFKTEVEAGAFCNSCNEGSDGLIYENVDYVEAIEYSNEHDLEINF